MPLPPQTPRSACLVTGASSGIGAEIARELARRGCTVVLAARRADRLEALAAELADAHGVRAEAIACDLGEVADRDRLAAELERLELDVEVLVNNAGFGTGGRFHELDRERELRMVRVNVEAVVDLCARFLPAMAERGRGAVLNVASTSAFQPLPRQATYGGSKAFVLSFTETLHSDLTGTGVTATALCPGPVLTEFMESPGFEAAKDWPAFLWVSPDEVARAAVDALAAGRRVAVPGGINRVGAIAGRFAPRGPLLALGRRVSPVGR